MACFGEVKFCVLFLLGGRFRLN
uniref:Uncharacterized protein n=1 Tax=Arundo donax TaxID=35708 RepID=A0A0A8Z064_ARUDO